MGNSSRKGVAAVLTVAAAVAMIAGSGNKAPAAPTALAARRASATLPVGLRWPLVVRGDKGPRVIAIQYLLNERMGTDLKVNGIFGSQTELAIRRFQAKRRLFVTGKVSGQAWSRLIITVKLGSSGPAVSAVQYTLRHLSGNPPPPVTGHFGAATKAAIESFQTKLHISVDGIVGPVTWNALVIHEP
jgi:peptidoglycan hydrolase-like protein with peptidoglycan-binding domain